VCVLLLAGIAPSIGYNRAFPLAAVAPGCVLAVRRFPLWAVCLRVLVWRVRHTLVLSLPVWVVDGGAHG